MISGARIKNSSNQQKPTCDKMFQSQLERPARTKKENECTTRRRQQEKITLFLRPLVTGSFPSASSFLLCSRSSLSHFKARAWSCEPTFDAGALGRSASDTGHEIGSDTKDPARMWATCVGNAPRPSKMWVASSEGGKRV